MPRTRVAIWVLCLSMGQIWGQYSTKVTKGHSDLTFYASTHTLWKLVAGGGNCGQGSLFEPFDVTTDLWCTGSDTYAYSYNKSTQVWTKNATFGSGIVKLLYVNPSIVYALKTNMVVYWWSGSNWVWKKGQIANAWAGGDGTLFVLSNSGVLSESTDHGHTFTAFSSTWVGASVWDVNIGCAVNTSHQLFVLAGSSFNSFAIQPPGTPVGCLDVPGTSQDSILFATWDANGTVHEFNNSTGAWFTVTGLAASQLVARAKKNMMALDGSGHPYHWNVNAPSVTGNMTGSWQNGCPGPGSICNPNTKHKGTLQVKFHSGHGIDGAQKTQEVCFNCSMNLIAGDTNALCDIEWGPAGDPECVYDNAGNVLCEQSNANLGGDGGGGGDNMIEGTSTDFVSYSYNDTPFVAIIWPPDLTIGIEKVYTNEVCALFTYATCPTPYIEIVFEGPSEEVITDITNIPNESPWIVYTDYTIDTTNGNVFCEGPGIGQEYVPMYRSVIAGSIACN